MEKIAAMLPTLIERFVPIFISLIPTMILLSFLFHHDRKEKIPFYTMLLCLLVGALALFIAQILEAQYFHIGDVYLQINAYKLFDNSRIFFLFAVIEELVKFFLLIVLSQFRKNKTDPYYIILYSVLVSLGFGVLESMIYITSEINVISLSNIAVARSFTIIPIEVICGICMGYYLYFCEVCKKYKFRFFLKAIGGVIFLHTIYYIAFRNLVLTQQLFGENMLNTVLFGACIFLFIVYLIAVFLSKEIATIHRFFLNEKKYPNKFKEVMTRKEYIKRKDGM